jgi:hypothetical protein
LLQEYGNSQQEIDIHMMLSDAGIWQNEDHYRHPVAQSTDVDPGDTQNVINNSRKLIGA